MADIAFCFWIQVRCSLGCSEVASRLRDLDVNVFLAPVMRDSEEVDTFVEEAQKRWWRSDLINNAGIGGCSGVEDGG